MKKCELCSFEYSTLRCPCTFIIGNYKSYTTASLSDFNDFFVKKIIKHINEAKHKGLLIKGHSNTGKTHLAHALAKNISKALCVDYVSTSPHELSKVPSIYDGQILELIKIPVLIIDDINNSLFNLVYRRSIDKITICTTNLEYLDEKFNWRLKEFLLREKIVDADKKHFEKVNEYKRWEEYISNKE